MGVDNFHTQNRLFLWIFGMWGQKYQLGQVRGKARYPQYSFLLLYIECVYGALLKGKITSLLRINYVGVIKYIEYISSIFRI